MVFFNIVFSCCKVERLLVSLFLKRNIGCLGCFETNFYSSLYVFDKTLNRYLPFALLYFFFNSLGLPFGLTYTALLAPFFYWWILNLRGKEVLLPFFVIAFPVVFIQIVFVGVDSKVYLTSLLNLAAVYIFCQAFFTFLKKCSDPESIFKKIVIINFILCLIAIPFYFTSYSWFFWFSQTLTEGINDFERLRLFTYEPSYYATLFVPFLFFFFLKIILGQNKTNAWLLLPMIVLPYILSFSLGVIASILLSLVFVFIFYFGRLIVKKRVVNLLLLSTVVIIPFLVIFVFAFPGNTFLFRMENIFSGHDSSGNGRTFEAFFLSMKILSLKSQVWGIGIGQIKVIGTDIIKDFYLYPVDYKTVAIPNATAETLTLFGFVGLFLRFAVETFLFFYTKVWKNYYRLLLFVFMFVYQFSGSFITNIAEYVIWILAFTNVFKQFDVLQEKQAALPLYE